MGIDTSFSPSRIDDSIFYFKESFRQLKADVEEFDVNCDGQFKEINDFKKSLDILGKEIEAKMSEFLTDKMRDSIEDDQMLAIRRDFKHGLTIDEVKGKYSFESEEAGVKHSLWPFTGLAGNIK